MNTVAPQNAPYYKTHETGAEKSGRGDEKKGHGTDWGCDSLMTTAFILSELILGLEEH